MKSLEILLAVIIGLVASSCATTSSMMDEPVGSGQEKEFQVPMDELYDISRASVQACGLSVEDEQKQEGMFKIVGQVGPDLVSFGSLVRVLGLKRDPNKSTVRVITRARSHATEWATRTEYATCIFKAIADKIQKK